LTLFKEKTELKQAQNKRKFIFEVRNGDVLADIHSIAGKNQEDGVKSGSSKSDAPKGRIF